MTVFRQAPALTLSLGMAVAGGAAWAETSPWYVGASQSFGYDSNIFRRPADGLTVALPGGGVTVLKPEASGVISTTSLLGGVDIYPGRQHVYANVTLDARRYGDQPQLDSNGYGLSGGIDWETMERLSGTLKISAERRPGDYADPQIPSGTGRVLDEPVRVEFIARLGDYAQSRMWLQAGYFYNRIDNMVDFGTFRDFLGQFGIEGYDRTIPSDAVSFGARYRMGADIVLGADLRHERGTEEYRLRRTAGPVPGRFYNDYERSDIEFLARWTPSGASSLNARASYTSTTNTGTLGRLDYSGPTIAAVWEWRPTGKLNSTARLAYDTDIREETIGTTSNPAWSVSWNVAWEATSKVSATGGLRWSDRQQEGQSLNDRRQGIDLGVRWTPLRYLQFDCSIGRESRTGAGARRDYAATLTSCSAQALIR
jgi:hypothetical protein